MVGEQGNTLGGELVLLAKLREQRHVAGRFMSEPEILPDHDGGGVQPFDQHRTHELLSWQLRELVGEWQHADRISAQPAEQLGPVSGRAKQRRVGSGTHDLVRMWIEGNDNEWQAKVGADLGRPRHDAPVATMHAVEDPDRHDRAAPARWYVVQPMPAVHRQRPFRTCCARGACRSHPIAGRPPAGTSVVSRSCATDAYGSMPLSRVKARTPPAAATRRLG